MEYNDCKTGMTVFTEYKGKTLKLRITRCNPKRRTISFQEIDGSLKGRLSPSIIRLNKNEEFNEEFLKFERTTIHTNSDLIELLGEIKNEYSNIYEIHFNEKEMDLLDTVKISWNKRITYSLLGKYTYYRYETKSYKHNLITISSSLMYCPREVIKFVIYHETIHIKHHDHSSRFRNLENKFKNKKYCNVFESSLCMEVRNNGIGRIRTNIPKKRKIIPKPKTAIIIEKPTNIIQQPEPIPISIPETISIIETEMERKIRLLRENGLFPSFLDGQELGKYDLQWLSMKYKNSIKKGLITS